jgi:hypothetical protein
MIKSSPNNCPVPRAQQPIHEYEELKNAWLFRNSTLGWPSYISQIFWIWIWSWLVAGPVAAASFSPEHHLTQFLLAGTAGASVGVVLILVRLYLGWFYISDRLHSTTVFYEESGWYDGQTWSKPPEIVNRDRLIVNYEIKPILHRLQFTFMALAGIYLTGTIVWRWL